MIKDAEYWVMRVVAYESRGVWYWGDGRAVAGLALPDFVRSTNAKLNANEWLRVGNDIAEPVEVFTVEDSARERMRQEESDNPQGRYLLLMSADIK